METNPDAHPFLTKLKDKDFPQSSPIQDTFDIRQLHAEWLKIGGTPFGFRAGRQQISYGDQRVFGPGNWGNSGRFAWDAVMFKIQTDRFDSDLWGGKYLTYKSSVWPNRSARDFFTFVNYTQIKKQDSSGAAAGESGPGGIRAHTLGFQAEGRMFELLDAGATYARQTGRWAGERLRAGGASGKLGVTFPAAWNPRLGGQYTWGSGDSNPADGVHGTFDGVYGGRDIFFYGYLNLFAWANLRDAEVDFSVRPRRDLTGYVELHHFRLDQAADAWYTTGIRPYRRDPGGRSGVTLV